VPLHTSLTTWKFSLAHPGAGHSSVMALHFFKDGRREDLRWISFLPKYQPAIRLAVGLEDYISPEDQSIHPPASSSGGSDHNSISVLCGKYLLAQGSQPNVPPFLVFLRGEGMLSWQEMLLIVDYQPLNEWPSSTAWRHRLRGWT
jgi:hypothetical protein